ncbi:Ubiquitin thioesterase otubain-like [Striga hermonthica]|uniref:Ubiquitin thioesterase otubain-like n=1 Tax=Striga hermonthica TaxID=68872 RepID=A0A9N7RN71_STRHE|nr:Ubiquitin thioesterase otubain-like [Striga hermonthica]
MQNQDRNALESEKETISSIQTSETDEPLSSLAAEYSSGNSILLEKIKVLTEQYAAIRRARGDGNCFFRSFIHEELVQRSRDQSVSDYVVMFFRFITAGEIRKRSEFYEPFIQGLTNASVEQFCKSSVEPMGEESDHVHITALSDALGVAIRVVYLDRSCQDNGTVSVNHHDFVPTNNTGDAQPCKPFVNLLYRPGHYDILYPK